VFGGSLADIASIGAAATADVRQLNKPKTKLEKPKPKPIKKAVARKKK